jgi:IPT/TIG domain
VRSVVILALLLLLFLMVTGCGGGTQSQSIQAISQPGFSLTFSASALSVSQGHTSAPINISINPENGFSGSVQVTLTGLPAGVTSNPSSPFTIAATAPTSVIFGATPNAATGNFTITAAATSAALSDSATLALTVQNTLGYTAHIYPNPAFKGEPSPYKFLVYDQQRQFLYLSAPAGIDVFDAQNSAFKTASLTLYCPSYHSPGPCPDDDLRGMALLPGSSPKLVAADFGSQNVYLLDPDTPATPAVAVPLSGTAYNPTRLAPLGSQTVLVSLSAEAMSTGICSSCISQLDLSATPPTIQPLAQPELATITASPLVQSDAAGDRVVLAFATTLGGPLGIWDSASQAFNLSTTTEIATDLAVSAGGTLFATVVGASIEVYDIDPNLQPTLISTFTVPPSAQVPNRLSVPGLAMHPTGALVYQPFMNGQPPPPPPPGAPLPTTPQSGIDILDAHSGVLRLRVLLPEPLAATSSDIDALHASFVTLNQTGQNIFALTVSGLTVVQLVNVPLAIGTVSPLTVAASGGTALTIRGSGFQSGVTATITGKPATATISAADPSTLTIITPSLTPGSQQLTLTNPDGETTTLAAAFTAQ